jgi:hypothetical protein
MPAIKIIVNLRNGIFLLIYFVLPSPPSEMNHTLAQFVETLYYKLEGNGFDFPCGQSIY